MVTAEQCYAPQKPGGSPAPQVLMLKLSHYPPFPALHPAALQTIGHQFLLTWPPYSHLCLLTVSESCLSASVLFCPPAAFLLTATGLFSRENMCPG